MADGNPVQLVVAAFNDEASADAALDQLKETRAQGLIQIENAAVLRKDETGRIHISETADMGPKGAAIGGVAGAAIGLIAGPALLVPAAVGALIGGLAGKLQKTGFADERLNTMAANLTPGSSAIVAVVEHTWVGKVEEAMAEAGADAVTAEIGAEIASQLEAGHDVAYTVLQTQEGMVARRVAGGEDEIEGGMIVADEAGVSARQFVATEEGFAVRALDASDEGVVAAGAVGVADEGTGEEDDNA